MRKIKIQRPLIESKYPPKDTRVLWADIDERTGKLASIKEFNNGEWEEAFEGGIIEAEELPAADQNPNKVALVKNEYYLSSSKEQEVGDETIVLTNALIGEEFATYAFNDKKTIVCRAIEHTHGGLMPTYSLDKDTVYAEGFAYGQAGLMGNFEGFFSTEKDLNSPTCTLLAGNVIKASEEDTSTIWLGVLSEEAFNSAMLSINEAKETLLQEGQLLFNVVIDPETATEETIWEWENLKPETDEKKSFYTVKLNLGSRYISEDFKDAFSAYLESEYPEPDNETATQEEWDSYNLNLLCAFYDRFSVWIKNINGVFLAFDHTEPISWSSHPLLYPVQHFRDRLYEMIFANEGDEWAQIIEVPLFTPYMDISEIESDKPDFGLYNLWLFLSDIPLYEIKYEIDESEGIYDNTRWVLITSYKTPQELEDEGWIRKIAESYDLTPEIVKGYTIEEIDKDDIITTESSDDNPGIGVLEPSIGSLGNG